MKKGRVDRAPVGSGPAPGRVTRRPSLDGRKIRRRHEHRLHASGGRERTTRGLFRGGSGGDPDRIGPEGGPRFGRGLAVLVGEKIDQRLARAFVGVGRMIVTEVGDAVFREERTGVVAETGVERGDLPLGGG